MMLFPIIRANNFREVDEAIATMFDVLRPWAACVISEPDQNTIWKCKVQQCVVYLINALKPEDIALLPHEHATILPIFSRNAKHIVETSTIAPKRLIARTVPASQEDKKPVGVKLKGSLAALRRQVC